MRDHADVVRRLYFGRDDAEQDMADGLLREGFLPTRAYDAALSGRKTLIIGRKGSGKSAICMRLTMGDAQVSGTSLITPDDAAGDEIRRFELQGLTGETAKSLIWRYVFAVQAARQLVAHAKRAHGRRLQPSVRALRRFLRANGETEDERLYDRLITGIQGLQTSMSLEAFGVKASMDLKGSSEGARASRQLEVLERAVARAFTDLGCAERHDPFLLLVDQLEQVWSRDPDSNSMIIGLLLAAKHVAGAFGGALRCVLFLRSDIYDALDFGDADKFHGDEMRIDWTTTGLCDVVLVRASASLGVPLSPDQLWQEVFPRQVRGESVRQYLFSRALPRPRDVIQFLNLCRDTAANRAHHQIEEDDVVDATQTFSEWKLQDLSREYRVSYPFLEQLFVMFENTGYIVMRAAVRTRFEAHRELLHQRFPDYVNALTPQGVIDVLYGVGFLGVRRGSDVVYAGGAHIPVQLSENEFHIHPCFRPALSAIDPSEIYPYKAVHLQGHGWKIGASNLFQTIAGRDVGIGFSRGSLLVDSLVRSCERILRQLARSALPPDTREQVSDQVGRVMRDAADKRQSLSASSNDDPANHVLNAANYLNSLAEQLIRNGVADGDQGRSIARRIQTEASELIREVGGAPRS